MNTTITMPTTAWHTILDALDLAADTSEQQCNACRRCDDLAREGGDPCPAHIEAIDDADHLRTVGDTLLSRLAAVDPATFALAVAA